MTIQYGKEPGGTGLGKFGKIGICALLIAESAAAAAAFRYFFWSLSAYDPINRVLYHQEVPVSGTILSAAAALLLLIALPLSSGGADALRRTARAWAPLVGAGLLLLIPVGGTPLALLAAIALVCWGFHRHGSGLAGRPLSVPRHAVSAGGGLIFSLLLAAAGCLWGFYIQKSAYERYFLFYSDWGIYAEHCLKLAFSGAGTLRDWLVSGGHWNGAINLLMTGALRLFPAPGTVFLLNSAMIYSAVPLVYLLGRVLKLPPAAATAFAVFFFFTPVVSNQPLSLFYGFHPINLFPSCFLLFLIFRERKRRSAAILTAVFTLWIQETAAIFWFGYALVLAAEKKFLRAALLGGATAALFFILSHWAIPAAAAVPGGSYTQMFHYSQLGSAPWEVVLSPVLRPGAFWTTLLAPNNLEFALFLFMPFFFFFLRRPPELLLAGLPLLAGVCLQSSRYLQNTVLQYGVELNCLAVTAALFAAGRLFAAGDRRRLFGAFPATLFCVFALYLLTGQSVFLGKYPFSSVARRPSCREVMDYLKSSLSPGAAVHATQRLRAQLLFDHPTRAPEDPAEPGEYYLLETQQEDVGRIHAALLKDPTVAPVTFADWRGYEFVVFRKLPSPVAPPPLPFLIEMTKEEYEKSGIPVRLDSEFFSVRLQESERMLRFLFRLNRKAEGEFRFLIRLASGEDQFVRPVTFAHGLRTVSEVGEGTVFLVEIPADENSGELEVDIREEHR